MERKNTRLEYQGEVAGQEEQTGIHRLGEMAEGGLLI